MMRRLLDRVDVEAMTDGVLASFVEDPEFQTLRPPDDVLRAWVRWNIDMMMRWSVERSGPSESELDGFREFARISAANGAGADAVPRNYRRGVRYAWRSLMQQATDEERAQLLGGAELLFDFVDRFTQAFAEAYEQAAGRGGESARERSAQAVLDALLDRPAHHHVDVPPHPRPQDIVRWAERLELRVFDEAGHHAVGHGLDIDPIQQSPHHLAPGVGVLPCGRRLGPVRVADCRAFAPDSG